jgi:hypothetical protein
MGVSSDWNGAINVGTGCNSAGSCATGGPNWDGRTPFSRAEINFWGNPGKVWYDISQVCLCLHFESLCASRAVLTRLAHQIYGFNVGMKITTGDGSCPGFACGQLWNGCPVPGPSVAGQWNSCFSGCCSSAGACANGALPAGGVRVPGQRRYATSMVSCMIKRTDLFRRCCWVLARQLCGLHMREHGRDSDALPRRVEPLLEVGHLAFGGRILIYLIMSGSLHTLLMSLLLIV